MNQLYQKGFIPLWIIFVIVAALAATGVASLPQKSLPALTPRPRPALSVTPTASPSTELGTTGDIADWKTYRNEEYGFEVKYPMSWEVDDEEYMTPVLEGKRFNGGLGELMLLSINSNENNLPMDEWINLRIERSKSIAVMEGGGEPLGDKHFSEIQTIEINGIDAFRVGITEGDTESENLFISHSSVIIGFYLLQTNSPKLTLYNQILSTFKFIPSTSSGQVEPNPTADWQTYRNEQYGFEVKHPPNYEVIRFSEFIQISLIENLEDPEIHIKISPKSVSQVASEIKTSLGGETVGETLIRDKEVEFAGRMARELEYTSPMGGWNARSMIIATSKNTLIIEHAPVDEINQILSTFRFFP